MVSALFYPNRDYRFAIRSNLLIFYTETYQRILDWGKSQISKQSRSPSELIEIL
jgi:hypothetical protein